jgi:carbamate kinase
VGVVEVGELRGHAAAGAFAGGSMGPKVEAACRFADGAPSPDGFAAITSLDRIADAVARASGTIVSRSKE